MVLVWYLLALGLVVCDFVGLLFVGVYEFGWGCLRLVCIVVTLVCFWCYCLLLFFVWGLVMLMCLFLTACGWFGRIYVSVLWLSVDLI